MLMTLKVEILRRGIRQSQMAVALGWDPAKLSKIINQAIQPTDLDRKAIAGYLARSEHELFNNEEMLAV